MSDEEGGEISGRKEKEEEEANKKISLPLLKITVSFVCANNAPVRE